MLRRSGLALRLALALALGLPVAPVLAGPLSLGTARGTRGVELSLDGTRWLPLGGRSMPLLEGSRIRTTAGGAVLDLTDGTRLGLLPFSTLAVRSAGDRPEVSLESGRLTFRWAAGARLAVRTATARLTPHASEAAAGEVVAGPTTGVRLSSGRLEATGLTAGHPGPTASRPVLVASRDPFFLPATPAAPRVFAADATITLTTPGRFVFGPRGDSVGYLDPAGGLVVHPGVAADLTGPMPAGTVRLALARIPEARRTDATPLFDLEGGYVGYVAGPAFFPSVASAAQVPAPAAQAQAQAQAEPPFVETLEGGFGDGWPWYYYAGAVVAAGGLGLGIAAAAGGGGDDAPATPVAP